MPKNKDLKELEQKFDKLAEQLRRGWGKTHGVTQKELGVVRDAVRKQWNEEQKTKSQGREKSQARQPKKQVKTAKQQKNKSQDQGPGFGHSW
jgi:hypothetical protein